MIVEPASKAVISKSNFHTVLIEKHVAACGMGPLAKRRLHTALFQSRDGAVVRELHRQRRSGSASLLPGTDNRLVRCGRAGRQQETHAGGDDPVPEAQLGWGIARSGEMLGRAQARYPRIVALHAVPQDAFGRGLAWVERDPSAGPVAGVLRQTVLWASKSDRASSTGSPLGVLT